MKTASFAVLLVGIVTQLASAGLQLDISGVPGSEQVTFKLSGSDIVNGMASDVFSIPAATSPFDPSDTAWREWGNFDTNIFLGTSTNVPGGLASGYASTGTPTSGAPANLSVISNTLMMFSDSTPGGVSLAAVFIDDDGGSMDDDFSIAPAAAFSYKGGDTLSFSGEIVISNIDITDFVYPVTNSIAMPANSGSREFTNAPNLSVNVSAVPEPSSWVLLSLITGLVVSRNGVKRLFARWFSK